MHARDIQYYYSQVAHRKNKIEIINEFKYIKKKKKNTGLVHTYNGYRLTSSHII
jgi:hypothetical protein